MGAATDRYKARLRLAGNCESHPRELTPCPRCKAKEEKRYEEHGRWASRKKRYGIDAMAFATIVAQQRGCCALCGESLGDAYKKYGVVVDHDHSTGAVRGILHQRCNLGLGFLGDSVAGLQRALSYLKSHEKEQ